MLRILVDALVAGRATVEPPAAEGGFAGAAIGRFDLAAAAEPAALAAAVAVCPTGAISVESGPPARAVLDDGRCVMCGLCAEGEAAAFRGVAAEAQVARLRHGLVRSFPLSDPPSHVANPSHDDDTGRLAREGAALSDAVKKRLGRSAHIRHFDAGGCNGCEWELNQLLAPTYDLQRFGLDFAASPRHADVLLVTGVVTRNLALALIRTLDAMPRPRLILAVGACAISGGIFATSYASGGGVDRVVAVDGYVAGCPPRPWAVLRGLRQLFAE